MIKTIFREANRPEPTETVERSGLVKWGDRNLYPQFLNQLYYENPVHGGIINQKVKFITAGGVETDPLTMENGKSAYNLEEVIEILARDYEIGETWCALFKRDLVTKRWFVKPVDFELIRATKDGVNYQYSEDWSASKQGENTSFRAIKSIFHVEPKDMECIYVHVTRPKQRILDNGKVTQNYYPEPNYSGAITSIMAGNEMDFFTFSEVVNGFKGGTLVSLNNGVPESVEEQNKAIKSIKQESSNKKTQGGLVVAFSDSSDNAPKVEQLNGNDLDKRYIESNKEIVKKIMIAHGVISPALFGVMNESMFGSKEELETAYLLFKENYVQVRQRAIAEPLSWALSKLNATTVVIKFKDYTPSFLAKPLQVEMKSQKKDDSVAVVIGLFSKCGVPRDEVTILHSCEFDLNTRISDDEFRDAFLKSSFAELSERDAKILKMIRDGESYQAIAKALNIRGVDLTKALVRLGNGGYVDEWKVTPKGLREVASPSDFRVVYSYEKRPDVTGADVISTTRDFCRELISLNRVYTRQEIEQIGAAVDRDVWLYRGGWYYNPQTDKTTPFCRHYWKQNIVI